MEQRIVRLDLTTIHYGHYPPEDINRFSADYFYQKDWNGITFATDKDHLRKVIANSPDKWHIENAEKVRIVKGGDVWVMSPEQFFNWLS